MNRPTRLQIAAIVACCATPCCVPESGMELRYTAARFNDKLRTDVHPLTATDLAADLRYGFFRDGQDGGLISELNAFSPIQGPSGASARLVRSGCLFVGSRHDGAGNLLFRDELRVSWEVIGTVDRSLSPADEVFLEGHEEIGQCTYSSPVHRLLGEDPDAPMHDPAEAVEDCHAAGTLALTLPRDPKKIKNVPIWCRVGGNSGFVVAVEAYPPREENPDALCPAENFDGTVQTVVEAPPFAASGPSENGLFPACRVPAGGISPAGDATYRLRLEPIAPYGGVTAERWLDPDVMLVDDRRELVRAMEQDGYDFSWQTPVERAGSEGPPRWGENFTPAVRVARVQIVSRDERGGAERVETPAGNELEITIPRPPPEMADTVRCVGEVGDEGFSFAIEDDCATDSAALRALTPTYAVARVFTDPPIETPITWAVSLPGLAADRRAFIRFFLEVSAAPPAVMQITAVRDFGRLQVGDWRQNELVLENVGGRPLEVQKVDFAPGSSHPQDFSFLVAGDPVPLPLPIAATPGAAGVVELAWAPDATDAPILDVREDGDDVEVHFGDPTRGAGAESLVLYGEPALLVGDLLLRDDPAAVFVPAATALRPFALAAFAELEPPFVIGPGRSVRVVATVTPSQLGQRAAGVRVAANDAITGVALTPVVGQLVAEAIQGPMVSLIPDRLFVGLTAAAPPAVPSRKALLQNAGAADLEVHDVYLSGAGAPRFTVAADRGPAPFTLAPGEHSDLTIIYTPECDGSYGTSTTVSDHEALLVVETNDRMVATQLWGVSQPWCEAAP
jgi:hypothetical protein